jgi:hypothetical protein
MPKWGKWTTKLDALQDYKEKNVDILVPYQYVDASSGFKLGYWVGSLRSRQSNLSGSRRNDLDRMGFVWSGKRGTRPKLLVCNMACVDATTATMTTQVARIKKGAATYSDLNQLLDNAASIAATPTPVTSRSNNSCSSSSVIEHHNKAEDTDDNGKRATTRGSRSNKEFCSIRADMSTCAENRVSSRLLELDANIMKLQAQLNLWKRKRLGLKHPT